MQSVLGENGLFSVTITEMPDTLTDTSLKPFQVILSNWNNFPVTNCSWPERTKKALLNFVKNGGGIVFVHAAGSANYDWPEFQTMAVASWGDKTRHGKVAPFQVKFTNAQHPVTKGLIDFWTTDELWINSGISGTPTVLAEAFAPASNKGSDKPEPILFCGKFGEGRTFTMLLGHDRQTMKNLGFQTLLLRAAEWAASGKVTVPLPAELKIRPASTPAKLNWDKKSNALTLLNNDQIVWQYHFDPSEGKPYFHPLSTMDGTVMTGLRPKDHPWHRAVWFSWKFINGLNYWEEDPETGTSEGITDLKSTTMKLEKNGEARFEHEITYHPPQGADLLVEKRKITVSAPNEEGIYFMDWESSFTAMADEVILDRTPLPGEPEGKAYGGYAGFSVRLNNHLWDVKPLNSQLQPDDLHGKKSEWITYQMKNLSGSMVCLSIFDHPSNPDYPNKWYITNDLSTPFYYFSPALIFDQKLILKKGEKRVLKYRLLISSGEMNQKQISAYWNQFKSK